MFALPLRAGGRAANTEAGADCAWAARPRDIHVGRRADARVGPTDV